MAAACKALEGAIHIEIKDLGISTLIEDLLSWPRVVKSINNLFL